MIMKTINITLDVLVAFSVWCLAMMIAVFIAIMTLHIVVIGGFTAYHLMSS